MTYLLPPLSPPRAFEAAARHLSFKFAACELHVTPGPVGQRVKALEDCLGVRLFDRLCKQLILTPAGQEYLASVQKAFYRIAEATERLKPQGVATILSVGLYTRLILAACVRTASVPPIRRSGCGSSNLPACPSSARARSTC